MSRSGPIGQLGMRPRVAATDVRMQPNRRSPLRSLRRIGRRSSRATASAGAGIPFPATEMPRRAMRRRRRRSQAPVPQAQVQPLPFNRFPPPAHEADAGRGFASAAPQASGLPFNRFPHPATEPDPNYGYAPQASEQQQPPFSFPHAAPPQQAGSGPPWGQQADPRGYDLGNYMSAPGQQGYAQPEPAHFQPPQDPPSSAPRRATARPTPSSTRPWPRTRRSRVADAAV